MQRTSTLAIGVLAAICSIGAAHAGPLAKARAGMVQCFEPDVVRKTCNIISSYTFTKGTQIKERDVVMLSPKPLVVAKADSVVEVRGTAVCGLLRKTDLDNMNILIGGWVAPAKAAAPLKAKLEKASKPLLGKEVCNVYHPKGNVIIARATLDGKRAPDLTKEFVWVRPDDGYRVGP